MTHARTIAGLHVEEAGEGRPVVLVHAGIADAGMWEPQWHAWSGNRRLVRLDLRGFGRSSLETGTFSWGGDLVAVLEELALDRPAIVACSLGGRVALEVAVARPDLVGALVLVAPGLPDQDWSPAVRAFGAAEESALEQGDLDAAAELNVRFWVDGPSRGSNEVPASIRDRVREMQRRAFELQEGVDAGEAPLCPQLEERLAEIRLPTLILVGELDVPDFAAIADRIAAAIPGAELATVPRAAHLPSLERPEAFDALVLPFLDGIPEAVPAR